MYAHSCVDQGCTAVVIGSRAGVPDWIVWNCKDKYRKATFMEARRLMVSITLVVSPDPLQASPQGLRDKADKSPVIEVLVGVRCKRSGWFCAHRLHYLAPLGMSGQVRRALGMTIDSICARGGSDGFLHRRPPVRAYPPSSSPLPRTSLYFRRPGKAARNGPRVAE